MVVFKDGMFQASSGVDIAEAAEIVVIEEWAREEKNPLLSGWVFQVRKN